jgi:hypothetical protein
MFLMVRVSIRIIHSVRAFVTCIWNYTTKAPESHNGHRAPRHATPCHRDDTLDNFTPRLLRFDNAFLLCVLGAKATFVPNS